MIQQYFLGANCGKGFVSLYEGFPPSDRAFLHIIKGGPGGGKSGFMRAIAEAARERGLDVQQVLCSGDPDSLDGLYIPALGQAWVDGTAPHVEEPRSFGADSDYVNLGSFCRLPMTEHDADRAKALKEEYQALYAQAYALLEKAKALHDELESVYRPYMDFSALTEFTKRTIQQTFEDYDQNKDG